MAQIFNQTDGLYYLINEAKLFNNRSTLSIYENASVSIIHSGMFKDCTALTSISLPNVHTIEAEAFQGCTALTQVVLPNGYNIGESAFHGCTSLSLVALFNSNNVQPESANIGLSAFHNCTVLSTLYIGLNVPPILAGSNPNSVFSATLLQNATSTKGNIYVQANVSTTYQAANIWKANNLKSKIRTSVYTFE